MITKKWFKKRLSWLNAKYEYTNSHEIVFILLITEVAYLLATR